MRGNLLYRPNTSRGKDVVSIERQKNYEVEREKEDQKGAAAYPGVGSQKKRNLDLRGGKVRIFLPAREKNEEEL